MSSPQSAAAEQQAAGFNPVYNPTNSDAAQRRSGIATEVRRMSKWNTGPRPLHDDIMTLENAKYAQHSAESPLHDPRRQMAQKGLAMGVRDPMPQSNIVAMQDTRAVLKNALASAYSVSRPQDFPAFQPTKATGVSHTSNRPKDTPLFKPEPVPVPKRRLHDPIPVDSLRKIHAVDTRKDELAASMLNNSASSPIKDLRRGDAHGMPVSGRAQNKNITMFESDEKVHGRLHSNRSNKSNIVLSQECQAPVVHGRRRGEPTHTKASVY